jgi:hypothetical protein
MYVFISLFDPLAMHVTLVSAQTFLLGRLVTTFVTHVPQPFMCPLVSIQALFITSKVTLVATIRHSIMLRSPMVKQVTWIGALEVTLVTCKLYIFVCGLLVYG